MAAVAGGSGGDPPKQPFKDWTHQEPDFSSDDDEEEGDTDKVLLDLRPCLVKWGGCGYKSYMRKTGCLNLRCCQD